MNIRFRFVSLEKESFEHYFDLTDQQLKQQNIIKLIVNKFPGFPCRVSLADAALEEEVLLLNYMHHEVSSPYQSNGPIFIRKLAETTRFKVNEIPEMFLHRLLSIRGFNKDAMMIACDMIEGKHLKEKLV